LKITFALREFQDKAVNAHLKGHFLLKAARLEATLTFSDSDEKIFAPPKGPDGKFVLDLLPNDIPDIGSGTGPAQKKRITRLSLDFFVDFPIGSKTFHLLKIRQDFSLKELPTNTDQNIDYALSPFSWTHSSTSAMRTANANVHPLLDLGKLSQNLILMNALVLDLTEVWDHLHEKNVNYKLYTALTSPGKVTFKVFAHLGGNAFIWYGVVPSYLAKSAAVSPHIFYSPADYAEKQNIPNEQTYLTDNPVQFEARRAEPVQPAQPGRPRQPAQPGSDSAFDGRTLLLGYLLPPVDDDRIADLAPEPAVFPNKAKFIKWVTAHRRNVVNFSANGRPPKISPNHWSLGAGFEKAFYGLGENEPQQFLLMPQVYGQSGASKGSESDPHLKNIADAIVDLLQTNTVLLPNDGKDELVAKDKMILSCYSESGWDLWKSSNNNIDHIKAIIGIEPNSTNPKGRDLIPKLLARKIKVFIIGRHQGFNNHYSPEISAKLQSEIRFLPDEPRKVLNYPPDPDSNDFVKYRVARVTDENLDPLMLDEEKTILQDLAKRKKPIKGKAAIPFVFRDINNSDDLNDAGLESIFYSHNFALTGGQDMTLDDPDNFYGKPVSYRTFFQQAVEEIG
jgi:hypothetical protein